MLPARADCADAARRARRKRSLRAEGSASDEAQSSEPKAKRTASETINRASASDEAQRGSGEAKRRPCRAVSTCRRPRGGPRSHSSRMFSRSASRIDALTVAPELGVVAGQQHEAGQHARPELLDDACDRRSRCTPPSAATPGRGTRRGRGLAEARPRGCGQDRHAGSFVADPEDAWPTDGQATAAQRWQALGSSAGDLGP